MTGDIKELEDTIQYAIEDFERITNLEVTGISRNFNRTAISVSLQRKAEKVETVTAPPYVPRAEFTVDEQSQMTKCTGLDTDKACGVNDCPKCFGIPF